MSETVKQSVWRKLINTVNFWEKAVALGCDSKTDFRMPEKYPKHDSHGEFPLSYTTVNKSQENIDKFDKYCT